MIKRTQAVQKTKQSDRVYPVLSCVTTLNLVHWAQKTILNIFHIIHHLIHYHFIIFISNFRISHRFRVFLEIVPEF